MIVALWACAGEPAGPPDDLVVRGRLGPDGAVTDLHIQGGKIYAFGPAETPGDVLSGDVITAGFVDAHGHVAGLGKKLAHLDLVGASSYSETLDRVRAASTGDGWLVGRGWDQNDWTDRHDWPSKRDLDAILGDRPAALTRVDGHALWLDSAALAAAGITAATPDPAGGQIIRDESGEPTGVLIDAARDRVKLPEPTDAEREAQVVHALDVIAATGLTGVHDMSVDDATLAVYERLEASGRLRLRLWVYVTPESEAAKRVLREGPWGSGHLKVMGIKAFADGAMGSRGALLRAPYTDEPTNSGVAIETPARLVELATGCAAVNATLAVHAIGDQGVDNALDAFEAARAAHPGTPAVPSFRIEHAQVVAPEDRPRLAAVGAIASMQPTHATSDMPWAEARLGPGRVNWAYSWRSMLDSGATLAFGSDFPVEEVDPGLGLWAATTRTDAAGNPPGGWLPEQKLTIDEAIDAFTRGAAAAVGERELGAITSGAPADLTLWTVDPAGHWHATATIVSGDVVWKAP